MDEAQDFNVESDRAFTMSSLEVLYSAKESIGAYLAD